MTHERNRLPWAVPTPPWADLLPGVRLESGDASLLFGEHFDPSAEYVVADRSYTRRVIAKGDAVKRGLDFFFDGRACANRHVDVRRLRDRGTPVCLGCTKARRSRSRRRWRSHQQPTLREPTEQRPDDTLQKAY